MTQPPLSETNSHDDPGYENSPPLINSSIMQILDAFPQPTALLDPEERVISVNINFLKLFSIKNSDQLTGKQPVEMFRCISADTIYEQSNAGKCHECGVILNLKGNRATSQRFTERCNLTFADETGHLDELHNMKVTTSPFTLDGERYYLFSITDISHEVRRRLLDKIFFHDVLNKAGNIVGILDILNLIGNDDKRSDELYQTLKSTSNDLICEIKYQRDLSSAENNELIPVFLPKSSFEILDSTRKEIVNSAIAFEREITLFACSPDQEIVTDDLLLRRILINMLKNALEATNRGGKVILGCEQVDHEYFRFWVHNEQTIPVEIQQRLFKKTTSTKGANRGLGTFSIKLIGEKYLKGKVNFISSAYTGTYFMIDLPKAVQE